MSTLQAVSAAVDLLQLLTTGFAEYQKVSDIISKRIAEGRTAWTLNEMNELTALMNVASTDASKAVDILPD